jgi:hypothetical protein
LIKTVAYQINVPPLSPNARAWHVAATSKLMMIELWHWTWYMLREAVPVASITWNWPTCENKQQYWNRKQFL